MTALWLPEGFDWKEPNYEPVWAERMRRLAAIREPGFDLAALLEFYKSRPANFIHDWACTIDPRAVDRGQQALMPFLLMPRQIEFIDWMLERWKTRTDGLAEKTRDAGLSWMCCAFAVWMMCFHPGSVVGLGSRKEMLVDNQGDSASLFFKIRSVIEHLPPEMVPKHVSAHMRITAENGASITGEAGNAIGRGGRASLYVVDEHAHVENADSIEAALAATANTRIYVSTPLGAGNLFARKRHSGKISVFTFQWTDDLRKPKKFIEEMRKKFDDVVVAQEFLLDYTASVSNAFIPGSIVSAAASRGPFDVQAIGPVQVGIDVARFGDDKSVITFRQGRVVLKQIVFGKADVVDVAGRAKAAIMEHPEPVEQIAVDTIGIGAGVADILRRDFGEIVVDVNSSLRLDDGRNYNLRAKMWSDMREWLRGTTSIPNEPELTTELSALQYEYRTSLLLMESKDDAKKRGVKSPDRADSLALTFAEPVKMVKRKSPQGPGWAVLDSVTGY